MGYKSQKKEVMISSEIGKEIIKKELPLIPKLPGVYKMLSDKDQILYVGKAKNLPNRLKSYVSEKNHIIRTERMLSCLLYTSPSPRDRNVSRMPSSA